MFEIRCCTSPQIGAAEEVKQPMMRRCCIGSNSVCNSVHRLATMLIFAVSIVNWSSVEASEGSGGTAKSYVRSASSTITVVTNPITPSSPISRIYNEVAASVSAREIDTNEKVGSSQKQKRTRTSINNDSVGQGHARHAASRRDVTNTNFSEDFGDGTQSPSMAPVTVPTNVFIASRAEIAPQIKQQSMSSSKLGDASITNTPIWLLAALISVGMTVLVLSIALLSTAVRHGIVGSRRSESEDDAVMRNITLFMSDEVDSHSTTSTDAESIADRSAFASVAHSETTAPIHNLTSKRKATDRRALTRTRNNRKKKELEVIAEGDEDEETVMDEFEVEIRGAATEEEKDSTIMDRLWTGLAKVRSTFDKEGEDAAVESEGPPLPAPLGAIQASPRVEFKPSSYGLDGAIRFEAGELA